MAHRRAGKTVAMLNDLIDAALRCPLTSPRFAYVAPFYAQAKDIAWGYLKHYTAAIPGASFNEGELRVDLPGDRRVRLYGADNFERLRGIYLDGLVLDEYGDMDPRAWSEVLRATLTDRQGWAVFAGTPKGANHFAETWERATLSADWLALRLPASQTGILPEAELQDAAREMSPERYQAEFECSFEASIAGAIWGREMAAASADGRIGRVPYQPEVGVETWWDLGMDDATAIWFTQNVGREVHVIDYWEESGSGLPGAARALQAKPYVYAAHHAPHDIAVRELGTGRQRIETARDLGIRFEVVPNIPKADGIEAGRSFVARCWFDAAATERGRLALVSYHRRWDERRKVFSAEPEHDWSSHAADAWRYLAVGHKVSVAQRATPRVRTVAPSEGGWMAA